MNHTSFGTLYGRMSNRLGHWMEHHPIASNCLLCLNLWVTGDTLAQHSEYKHLQQHNLLHNEQRTDTDTEKLKSSSSSTSFWQAYDPLRTFQCASYGAAVSGPILAVWYPYLEQVCVRYNIAARYGIWGAPIFKVLADELIMDPPTLLMFFGYMNICEGGTWQTFSNKVSTQFWPSWFTSLAVWPVILLGTFRFLKTYAHAPVISVCCIVWDGFLSHRNFLAKLEKGKEPSSPMDDSGNYKTTNQGDVDNDMDTGKGNVHENRKEDKAQLSRKTSKI